MNCDKVACKKVICYYFIFILGNNICRFFKIKADFKNESYKTICMYKL